MAGWDRGQAELSEIVLRPLPCGQTNGQAGIPVPKHTVVGVMRMGGENIHGCVNGGRQKHIGEMPI